MNHSYRLGCKCAIKEPKTCKGDANISLGINHAWFRGLALQIHWLKNWSLINSNLLRQGRLTRNKILVSSSRQIRYKYLIIFVKKKCFLDVWFQLKLMKRSKIPYSFSWRWLFDQPSWLKKKKSGWVKHDKLPSLKLKKHSSCFKSLKLKVLIRFLWIFIIVFGF
jgi:hypothetical protein